MNEKALRVRYQKNKVKKERWKMYDVIIIGAGVSGAAAARELSRYNAKVCVIEKSIKGTVNGNDIGAGFEEDWVQMLELNEITAADGTVEKMQKVIRQFEQGKLDVFRGDYVGADPDDPDDTYDLNQGYTENEFASAPSFHYVLKDVIRIEE
jgi:choline dehydrogenase-like flavoprotein